MNNMQKIIKNKRERGINLNVKRDIFYCMQTMIFLVEFHFLESIF